MKKREYIIPEIQVVELGNEVILAGSVPEAMSLEIGGEAITDDNKVNFDW